METVHFCPPAAKEGGRQRLAWGMVAWLAWCGHCLPLAKSPHPKVELSKSCHDALTVEYLEICSPHPKRHRSGRKMAVMVL